MIFQNQQKRNRKEQKHFGEDLCRLVNCPIGLLLAKSDTDSSGLWTVQP
jgi:hypothetical protein